MKKNLLIFSLIILFIINFSINAQQSDKLWKFILKNFIKKQEIAKVYVIENGNIKQLPPKCGKEILDKAESIKGLQNPDCRCLPPAKARIIFIFKNNSIFTTELVKSHWFQGVFIRNGMLQKFYLKDEKNIYYTKIYNCLEGKCECKDKCKGKCKDKCKSSYKEIKKEKYSCGLEKIKKSCLGCKNRRITLCKNCRNKMFVMMMGTCAECGGPTASIAYKYCKKCALKKGVCQACGKKLDEDDK